MLGPQFTREKPVVEKQFPLWLCLYFPVNHIFHPLASFIHFLYLILISICIWSQVPEHKRQSGTFSVLFYQRKWQNKMELKDLNVSFQCLVFQATYVILKEAFTSFGLGFRIYEIGVTTLQQWIIVRNKWDTVRKFQTINHYTNLDCIDSNKFIKNSDQSNKLCVFEILNSLYSVSNLTSILIMQYALSNTVF